MGTVKWTPRALNDLQEIHDFIYRDSPHAAETFVDRLLRATERLASFPQSGRAVRDYVELGYREIIVGNYRVLYRLEGDMVVVAVIVHGRRLLGAETVGLS